MIAQDHVFTLKTIISRRLQIKKDEFTDFINIKKASDRIGRAKIWNNMRRLEGNERLMRTCKSIHIRTRNIVATKNITSREFETGQGVRQCGSLNPLLFIILIYE